jgi:hypothetical protein
LALLRQNKRGNLEKIRSKTNKVIPRTCLNKRSIRIVFNKGKLNFIDPRLKTRVDKDTLIPPRAGFRMKIYGNG